MAAPDQQRGKPTGEKYMQTALSQIKTRTNSVGNAAELGFSDRVMPSVSPPATNKPTDSEFYEPDPNSGGLRISHDFLKSHFFKEGRLTEAQALFILERAIEVLKREDNLVTVQSPITICGDIHGQYYDLMKLFEVGGNWIENRYLFLGDYVDRGSFGIECLLYLYTLKINFPTRFTLLRGNHECRHLTEYFTFKRECLHKYSEAVYEKCIESFCALPLGAIVDGRFFCVHGGISPELLKVEDMRRLNRFMEPGSHGLLCDLLWADPYPSFGHENESGAHPALAPGTTFVHNQTRGCSFFYTYEAACQFLERNGLLGIIRGHEAQNDGYTMYRKTPSKKFPSVITIFSAPNYLDVYRNRGAVLKYQNKNITIRQYNSSPHPYWLPNFMDAFTWSLPFVGAKIAEMLLAVLSVCSQEELVDSESDSEDEETKAGPDAAARRQQIKSKIIAVGRMQRVFQLLREEAENATELNVDGPMSDGTPANASGLAFGPNALTVQGIQINRSIHNFTEARHSDILNERLPEFAQTQQTIFPAPSMRVLHTTRRSTGDSVGSGRASPNSVDGGSGTPTGGTMPGGLNMEYLIKKTLEEDEEQGSMVERLADSIARVRKAGVLGKPEPLKRHGTA